MVRAEATRSADGCLRHLSVCGHISAAGGPYGANALCGAVSGLVRSCAQAIAGRSGIEADGAADTEGTFELSIRRVDESEHQWLLGVTDVLVGGLRCMAQGAPDEMEFREADPGHQGRVKG